MTHNATVTSDERVTNSADEDDARPWCRRPDKSAGQWHDVRALSSFPQKRAGPYVPKYVRIV